MRKFDPSEVVDFVVIGSGAAGGILARELSVAGFSVVVLEQGPRLNPSDFEHDEFMLARSGTLHTLSACTDRFDAKAFGAKEPSHQLA